MLRDSLVRSLLVLALTCPAAFAAPAAPAGKASGKPGDAAAPGDKDKPFQEWKKVTKDAEVMKGYLTLYKKRENLYLELKPEQMNTPVLGIFSLARGIGSNFILGGLPLSDHLLTFQREGDHVFVIEQNPRFTATPGSPMEKARDLSISSSVLASLKIESEQGDSAKTVLVDLAPLLVSDLGDLAEAMHGAFPGKSFRFDASRSSLGKIKVFPENDEIEALLTYSPNDRTNYGIPSVSDDRYVPITVHYSFSKLPEKPMLPRLADDRTGFFLTAMKDFSRDNAENFWVRYINHWRLEKKDPNATVSEVVKPIVFYIDRTVPVEYRQYVKEGIEGWQKAFEAAGLKNAIIAKDAPDDSTWDAEDVRYSTVRWITSSEPAFGAIGPSRVDPRTGEILDADILFESSFIQSFRNTYRRFAGPEAIGANTLPSLGEWPKFLPQDQRCDAQMGMADGGALLHVGLLVDGLMAPGDPVPIDFIGKAIKWSVMHEVGHSLGLRHNFRSSTSTPYDKLNDVAWTSTHGLISSVMDYPAANISPDHAKQGDYYTTTAGDCDVWNIRYGYTPTGTTDSDADYAVVKKIADESNQPGHEFSTDEDTYPADALDPRTNIWDLGSDPLAYAKDRAAYIASLWKNPNFESRIVGPSGDYTILRRAMDTLLGQYGLNLGLAVKYVGGQYPSRNHRGQPDARDPLTPVPAAKQREALDFLSQRAFAADAFTLSPTLLNRMAPDRWSHWGMASAFGPGPFRLDYSYNDRVYSIQSALLNGLTSPALLARMREGESHSVAPYKLSEHFDRLTRALWGEVGGETAAGMKALDGTSTRRELQRAYVDRLAAMVANPAPGTPDDARALARLQLTRIDARAARSLAGKAPLGDYVRAHLIESRARIKRSLDAERSSDAPGARLALPTNGQ
jgi:Met-zincin/Domain of unknown function (DUF5117)